MTPNVGNMTSFHHGPPHVVPMPSTQSLPRNMPPAPTAGMSASHRRRLERQNARNSTANQTHGMPVGASVPTPSGPCLPPPNLTNPFGAPGSGRRPGCLPPQVVPSDAMPVSWPQCLSSTLSMFKECDWFHWMQLKLVCGAGAGWPHSWFQRQLTYRFCSNSSCTKIDKLDIWLVAWHPSHINVRKGLSVKIEK